MLQQKYADKIRPDDDLPEEYMNALLRFKHYLNQASKGPFGQLKSGAVASPPLRAYFVRDIPEPGTSTRLRVMQTPGVKFDKVQTEMMWLLRTLWEDNEQLFLAGMTNVLHELERLVQAEPKANVIVTSYVAGVLADLSVVTEATRQVNIYQPWAQTFEHYMAEKDEELKEEYAARNKHWGHFLGVTEGSSMTKPVKLGNPSDRKFYYPVDKRRSKENVEAMRSAEQNSDAFWAALDKNVQARIGDGLKETAVRRVLAQTRSVERTPEWVEPSKDTKDIEAGEVHTLIRPLSEVYFELEHRTEATVNHLGAMKSSVTKEKTHGTAAPPTRVQEELTPSAKSHPQPTFAVDARALKVFRTLFYTPSVSATPGEVPWTDFLHAMAAVGFLIEKLYGSVWQFQPTELDVERSIQFHEPHGNVSKMAYRVARRFERRLERAYGWVGTEFVLREKGGSG